MDAIELERKDPGYFRKKINPDKQKTRALLSGWIEKDYHISKRHCEHIVSIVNDGFGQGKTKF